MQLAEAAAICHLKKDKSGKIEAQGRSESFMCQTKKADWGVWGVFTFKSGAIMIPRVIAF